MFLELYSPELHQGEEQPDTEVFLRAVPFILRYLLEWWGKKKIVGEEMGEIGRSLITGRMIFHILFML